MTPDLEITLDELWRSPEKLAPELVPYLESADADKLGWPMLRHPLVYSIPHFPQMNGLANRQLFAKKQAIAEAWDTRSWHTYVWLHERPWRLDALEECAESIEVDADYWKLVGQAWIDSENITSNPERWIELLSSARGDKHAIMEADERKALTAMPERFRVWQGHTEERDDGWSWTVDKPTAEWFARRFAKLEGDTPYVTVAMVDRANVTAYFARRGEFEILVDPDYLSLGVTAQLWI